MMNQCTNLPSVALLAWLQVLLSERIHADLKLELISGGVSLHLVGAEHTINILATNEGFYSHGIADCCTYWRGDDEGWLLSLALPIPAPGVESLPNPLVVQSVNGWVIRYDLLGLAYWAMSRVEEIGSTELDSHARFPSTASHAYRHGYLERPVVDEWLDLLRQVALRAWPGIILQPFQFAVRLSHDVDAPSRYAFGGKRRLFRAVAGAVIKERHVSALWNGPRIWAGTSRCLREDDPYNTFDWIMDCSERYGLQSAFYFICGRTNLVYDAHYNPEHPAIRTLLRNIYQRGHEIGLHPSYNTFLNPDALVQEADTLRAICNEEGVKQTTWGGRMHFLRWRTPDTFHAWVKAKLSYDSSLGYADAIGFRCGTCMSYMAFDAIADISLPLRLYPLIAMDSSVTDPRYMGVLDPEDALARLLKLKSTCRAVGGEFTTLWHNTSFVKPEWRDIYNSLLSN